VIQTKSQVFAEKAVLVAPTALGPRALAMERRSIAERLSFILVHSQMHAHAVTPLRNLIAIRLLAATTAVGRALMKRDPTNVARNFC